MTQTKPCHRCGRERSSSFGKKNCGYCLPVDAVWPRLVAGNDGCWLYQHRVDPAGYGRFGGQLVHRLVFEALVGEIPDGLDLDHLCRTKNCANPSHLDVVTRSENSRRKWARYLECRQGHALDEANTYITTAGHRSCRRCTAASAQRYRDRRKELVS